MRLSPIAFLWRRALPAASLLLLSACGEESQQLAPLPVDPGAVVSGTVMTAGAQPEAGAVLTLQPVAEGVPASVQATLAAVRGGAVPGALAPAGAPAGVGPAALTAAGLRVTTTDAAGRYAFAGVAAGDYLLEARAGHHLAAARPLRIEAPLSPATTDTTFVDIALVPTGTFSGRALLWAASNHQSTVVYVTGTSAVAVTDAAGGYLLRDVPIGAHTITATHESWLDATTGGTLLAAGDSVGLTTITLNRTWNMEPLVTAGGPATVEVGVPAAFTCSASDPDGTITLYEWDFDDDGVVDYSSNVTGNVSHTFSAAVPRSKVRVTDDRGAIAIAVVNVTVYDGVYVSILGSDSNSGVRTAPKQTLPAAVALAQTFTLDANRRVVMSEGNYVISSDLSAGTVNISGGHDLVTWLRTPGHQSVINCSGGANLRKDGSASSATYLVGLDVRQITNTGKPCVQLNGTNGLAITECRFVAAAGTAGANGGTGTDGAAGPSGVAGQAGSSNSSGGGVGGNGTSVGGSGGLGGYNSAGSAGANGPEGAVGGSGGVVSSGCFSVGGPGGIGANGGNGTNGPNGAGAGSGLTISTTIATANGSAGTGGTKGNSGGGGGGGGGGTNSFPCNADRAGGGGEGGEGGGLGTAGGGGLGGLSSVAVLVNAVAGVNVTFTNCVLQTAAAGKGGNGGDGGAGGAGGPGGNGGPGADDAGPGGKGGNGGTGGSGGGGSGGAGGWSVGLLLKGAGSWSGAGNTFVIGAAGVGGTGGKLGGTGAQAPSGPNGTSANSIVVP